MMTMTWKILLGFQSYQVNPKTPVLILPLKKLSKLLHLNCVQMSTRIIQIEFLLEESMPFKIM